MITNALPSTSTWRAVHHVPSSGSSGAPASSSRVRSSASASFFATGQDGLLLTPFVAADLADVDARAVGQFSLGEA